MDADGRRVRTEVVVESVVPGSVAERIRLAAGDRIISYDSTKLASADQLIAFVTMPGTRNRPLVVRRGGRTMTIEVPPGRLGIILGLARAE